VKTRRGGERIEGEGPEDQEGDWESEKHHSDKILNSSEKSRRRGTREEKGRRGTKKG